MRDRRWWAAALLVAGLACASYGWLARWIAFPSDISDREALATLEPIVGATLSSLGAAVAVLIALLARDRDRPPAARIPLGAAALAAIAFGLAGYAVLQLRSAYVVPALRATFDRYDEPSAWRLGDGVRPDGQPLYLTLAPYVMLVGLAASAAAATWLARIVSRARIARAQWRAAAIAQGVIAPEDR